MYSLLLQHYIKEPKRRLHLLRAIHTVPCVRKEGDCPLAPSSRFHFGALLLLCSLLIAHSVSNPLAYHSDVLEGSPSSTIMLLLKEQ